MRLLAGIAVTYLTSRKRQTFVSLIGVALGVGFFIGIASMMQGFQHYFVQKVIDTSPHIVIKDEYRNPPRQPVYEVYKGAEIALEGTRPKEELRGVRNAKTIMSRLEKIKGVHVAPLLRGQVFLRYGGKDVSANMMGIDPEREKKIGKLEEDMVSGGLSALLTSQSGIILGSGLAANLGVRQGDAVSVVSPAGIIFRMKVVGIFNTGITLADKYDSYALIKKAQVLQNKPNVINQVRIKLDDVKRSIPFAAELENSYGYLSEPWEEANKNIFGIFIIQNGIMYSTVSAILIVAGFGIFNIISTVVFEKTRDIAILKTMGFSGRDVNIIFLMQGVITGIIGTLAGWVIGYMIVTGLGMLRFEMEGFIKSQGFVLYKSFSHYLLAGTLAVIASSFAALLPARKAGKLRPVDIVRGAT